MSKRILKIIKNFLSYTNYMNEKGKINEIGLSDFLTERGKEIVARLDEIALELDGLYVEDPQLFDASRVSALVEESCDLIENQGRF